ncbi:MAG: twitch domain-containing radical SAM protein, partial [Thermoanaerobaculia bacterium]
ELLSLRAAMAGGEKADVCRICWEHESVAPLSLRQVMNEGVHAAMGAQWSLIKLMRESAKTGFHSAAPPKSYQLQLGNTCNLRCRSCSPQASSRIAADPVHRAWSGYGLAPASIPYAAAWFRDLPRIADLVGAGDEDVLLSLLGGEPFLIDEVWKLLELLAERGASKRIRLGLVTNGTVRRPELERLVPEFRSVYAGVSVDGYGRMFEYLRHGGKWSELVRNLEWMQGISGLSVGVTPTLQNTNALGAVNLFRFLDERGINLQFNVLTHPARLRAANLPPRVRRIAAQRLRAYLEDECRPANRPVVQGWAGLLEAENRFDPRLFDEFMEFTNDLDASRGQRLAFADPELFTLLRASGIRWKDEGRHVANAPSPVPVRKGRINRAISPRDAIWAAFATAGVDGYFTSGISLVQTIDSLLCAHGHEGLAGARAVADFASHYGRLTRVLCAEFPDTVVYACDIDRDAVEFCEREFGATPVITSWRPDEDEMPRDVDAVICISLLTHTTLQHWRRTLRAWQRMLRPGGIVIFTFLSEGYLEAWLAGQMEAYGDYSADDRLSTAQELREHDFGFVPLPEAGYGGERSYGVTFATSDLVRREIAAAGLETLDIQLESPAFNQSVAVVRKPGERDQPMNIETKRDVRLVALFDPRCYPGDTGDDMWTRLVALQPRRPLPADLGFCDPRVTEVRETQAALAREHGIDAFCYLYAWSKTASRSNAPMRALLETGRPDFPFCLMLTAEGVVSVDDGDAIINELLPYLRDPRYVRVDGRPLLIVRDVASLREPRGMTTAWRRVAAANEIGEIHLCASEPLSADSIAELGFDSVLESTATEGAYPEIAAAALARQHPGHALFRNVVCRREPFEDRNVEHYELWLRATIESSDSLVFVSSWNGWTDGNYLEPDDRDGARFLAATRRAVRGPGSALALLRRLRDTMTVDGPSARILTELEQVVRLHERSRDELTALVEAAFTKSPQVTGSWSQRWVPVEPAHLPPSPGRVSIDQLGAASGAVLHADQPVVLDGDDVIVYGWAHAGDAEPAVVDLFLVLTSESVPESRVFRINERNARPDVVASFPGYPERC